MTYAIFAALLIVIALSVANYLRSRPEDRAAVAPAKSRMVEAAPAGSPEVTGKGAASVPENLVGGAPVSAAQQPSETAPVAPSAAVGERPPASEAHSLFVAATEKTWMRLRFRDGKSEDVLLAPGESRTWSFSGRVSLKIGNAGGITLSLDGANLGRPGGRGQIATLALPAQ